MAYGRGCHFFQFLQVGPHKNILDPPLSHLDLSRPQKSQCAWAEIFNENQIQHKKVSIHQIVDEEKTLNYFQCGIDSMSSLALSNIQL